MNSRFLASPGGRLANIALFLAFLVLAYAAISGGKVDAIPGIPIGILVVTGAFIVAAILSVERFPGYSFAIGILAPMAGFYYVYGLQVVTGVGLGVGCTFAAIGVFALLAGIVLGLRTSTTSDATGGRQAHRPVASNVGG